MKEGNNQFNIRTPEYLESYKPFFDSDSLNQITVSIQKHIKETSRSSLRCLDSMAGTGIVGHQMKVVFPELQVVYQDKSQKMLSSRTYQNDERVLSDATALGMASESFDIVFCRGGLNNVSKEDYLKIFGEYIRVLREGGVVILQDHFAQTEEAKNIINQIETEVTNIEGRNDETYVPTMEELREFVREVDGKILNEQSFEVRLPMKDRFMNKGISNPNLSTIRGILKKQNVIRYEETEDDIVLIYPIITITFQKMTPTDTKPVYNGIESEPLSERAENMERAVEKGWQFLKVENQEGFFPSYITSARDETSTQQAIHEIFSSIAIANTLSTANTDELSKATLEYIENQAQHGLLTFFEDKNLITPDTDTNSLGYSVLLENDRVTSESANRILDSILAHRDDNEIIRVWLSKERVNHSDHVVGANALYFANLLDRGDELRKTEDWLITILDSRQYLEGSRYYPSPDSFLYLLGRLIKFPALEEKLKIKLEEHLQQRIGKTEYPLDLAMRVVLADSLGVKNDGERQKLLKLQNQDGSWPADALYRQGKKAVFYSNKSLPTAFALRALGAK